MLSTNSHDIHVHTMCWLTSESHAGITRVGPRKKRIPTTIKCLPLICLLINDRLDVRYFESQREQKCRLYFTMLSLSSVLTENLFST